MRKTQKEIMQNWKGDVEKPLVSICSITYNHEKFIEECLDGFLMQETNFPFEILIHDDASTDKTADIIREYEAKYPDIIKPIYQTENQFSKGIRTMNPTFNYPRVKGKYIALCEGDDYWTAPDKLQKQVDFLEVNAKYSACTHNTKIIYAEDKEKKDELVVASSDKETYTIEDFSKGEAYFHTTSVVYRNIFNGKIPKKFINEFSGDWLWLLLHSEKGPIKYINEVMSVYRIHEKGVWTSLGEIKQKTRNLKAILLFNKIFDYKYEENFLKMFTRVFSDFSKEKNIEVFHEILDGLDTSDLAKVSYYAYKAIVERDKEIVEKDKAIVEKDRVNTQINQELEKIKTSKLFKLYKAVFKRKNRVGK